MSNPKAVSRTENEFQGVQNSSRYNESHLKPVIGIGKSELVGPSLSIRGDRSQSLEVVLP